MSSPTSVLISVRNVINGEPQYGNGTQNYVTGAAAMPIIILSTLRLLTGEFFLNLKAGVPYFQNLLNTQISPQAVALIWSNAILGVPFVTGVSSMQVVYQPQARAFTFTAQVETVFGPVIVSG